MLHLFVVAIFLAKMGSPLSDGKIRLMHFEGKEIRTTYATDKKFLGKYEGKKSGYLLLKEDGTGEYSYDIFGIAPLGCKPGVIIFEWGFLLDQNNEVVRNERDYGYSYPILLRSTGDISFQGCSKKVFLDFLLEYNNGELHVSSSDDWVKKVGGS